MTEIEPGLLPDTLVISHTGHVLDSAEKGVQQQLDWLKNNYYLNLITS